MYYPETKVYFDGSHYIAIPHTTRSSKKRKTHVEEEITVVQDEQNNTTLIETKGTTSLFNLKTPEQLKIHCGMEHFKALDNGLEMHVATDWNKFKINE